MYGEMIERAQMQDMHCGLPLCYVPTYKGELQLPLATSWDALQLITK